MELRRLSAENYYDLIKLLNDVFGHQGNKTVDFESVLPNMCKRTDEAMGKHLGVFDGTRLVSALGVYPLPGKIGDTDIMFSTTGNVATHWEYEGKGCMSLMLKGAMDELNRIGADISRLGGLRQRYSRFGFEACGTQYDFTLTDYNICRQHPDFKSNLEFAVASPEDTASLEFAKSLYERNSIFVHRADFYQIVTAWHYVPYIVLRGGTPVGFISALNNGSISEFYAIDASTEYEMLLAFCLFLKRENGLPVDLKIPVAPYRLATLKALGGIAEIFSSTYPSRFKIISYDKVVDALLRLKTSLFHLPDGEATVYIEAYGALRLFVSGGIGGCEKISHAPAPDVSLSYPEAARFFFGPLAPIGTAPATPLLSSWLPLPLGWSVNDRV